MRFITISGVDGSGKSTQLELLRRHLEAQGKQVAYFHAVEFSLANRIARFLKGERTFEPGKDRAVTSASWISVIVREKFLFCDFLRFRLLRRRLARQGFDYLLSDRSFYDSLVNLVYLSDAWITRACMRSLFLFLPRADTAIYLDLDAETILSRERVPEQGSDYLRAKIALFQQHKAAWGLVGIAAGRDQASVLQDILAKIDEKERPITQHLA